jgi:hypothetical protein
MKYALLAHLVGWVFYCLAGIFSKHTFIKEFYGSIFPGPFGMVHEPIAGVFFLMGVFASTFGLYRLYLYSRQGATASVRRNVLMLIGGLFVLYFFLPPFLSTDSMSYYRQAWMFVEHGASPYTELPREYPGMPGLGNVPDNVGKSPYGPVWTRLSQLVYMLSGGSMLTGVLLFKALGILCAGGILWSLWGIARRLEPGSELSQVVLFGANPLILVEGIGMAHNELVGLVFVTIGVYFVLSNERRWLGFCVLSAALLIKLTAIVAVFVFFLWLYRESEGAGAFVKDLAKAAVPLLVIFIVAGYPFIHEPFDALRMLGVYTFEMPYGVRFTPPQVTVEVLTKLGVASETMLESLIPMLFLLAGTLMVLSLLWRARAFKGHAEVVGACYMVVTMVRDYWRPWFVLWPMTTVLLTPGGKWLKAVIMYSTLALASNVIQRSAGIYIFQSW